MLIVLIILTFKIAGTNIFESFFFFLVLLLYKYPFWRGEIMTTEEPVTAVYLLLDRMCNLFGIPSNTEGGHE